ncbi:sigma-54-dependent transcriptional regulator [Candidatus Latescibacterota bacterium]
MVKLPKENEIEMAKILVIDDDSTFCKLLYMKISSMGHTVDLSHTLKEGVKSIASRMYDVVFLDVRLPDGNGIDELPTINGTKHPPEVIIITGLGDPDGAELAIRTGAWDYIQKGYSVKDMILPLERALQYRKEKESFKQSVHLKRERIIGDSEPINQCLDLITQAANSDVNTLITGETGTGKELFASAIHINSRRSDKNFIIVDCTVLPDTLVESILFGHKKGAFTGADNDHDGLLKQADGGTLFLDEIGELPPMLQKTLLRVLEEHHFRPLGSKHQETSNFRMVAATNRNLEDMVKKGQFRKDLLFRISSFVIETPPLRARLEDIKSISYSHMNAMCSRSGMELKGFSPEYFSALSNYDWPGNVRELINTLDRSISAAGFERTLFPRHLPTNLRVKVAKASFPEKMSDQPASLKKLKSSKGIPPMKDFLFEVKKQYLHDLLSNTGGNKTEAAHIAGLSRARFYTLLKELNLS